MALARVSRVENQIIVRPFGSELLTPLISQLEGLVSEAAGGLENAIASFEAEASLFDPLTLAEVVGRAVDPINGLGVAAGTYVFVTPLVHDGLLRTVRVYGAGAGTFQFKVFEGSIGALTQVGSDVACVVVGTGLRTITFDPPIEVTAGQRLGFYTPNTVLTYTLAAADSGGFVDGGGNLSTVTDASATTTARIEVGLDVDYIYLDGTEYTETVANVASVATDIDTLRSSLIWGRTETPITGTSATVETFIYYDALTSRGKLTQVSIFSTAAGTVKIKRFSGALGSLVRYGTDETVTVAGTGLETFTLATPMEFNAGDRIGLYPSILGALVYTVGSNDNGGMLEKAGDADTASDTTAIASIRLQIQFVYEYVAALGTELNRADVMQRLLYGITQPLLLVHDGNSETAGDAPVTGETAHPAVLANTLGCQRFNFGVSGQTIANMTADAATQIDPLLALYPNHYPILLVNELYNSVVGGRTVSQAVDDLEAYCDARRAAGWDVIGVWNLGDMLGAMSGATRAAINVEIDSRWAGFADFLIDCRLDATLMDSADATYWQADRIHTNDAGQARRARLARRALRDWMMAL